jgi:carbon monoxide dehydrogenase subunit G
MLRVERTLTVALPASDVFGYLSDFTNTEQWDPGTVTTTRTSSGPIVAGSTFHNVSEFLGRRTELDYVLTRFEPTSHLLFTGNNKTATAMDDLTFVDEGGQTTITYRATFDFHGLAKLAEPFLRPGLNKLANKTIDQLQATLDGLTPG